MTKQASMDCYNVDELHELFTSLRELPEIVVQNIEWLYMLREDTCQSETYVASALKIMVKVGHECASPAVIRT